MSSMNFSLDQLKAINTEGTNIIVSAGAGSGKTAVLTERIKRKLKEGCKASELLVLTFTNAAAAEMKDRVISKMKEDLELSSRVDEVDSAYITTFDSFAISIVKKYHYVLNLSKNISIINSSALNVYKRQILEEIFNKYYEANDEEFEKLLNDLTIKDDKQLKANILNMANKIDLLTNRDEYLNTFVESKFNDQVINSYIKQYEDMVLAKVKYIQDNLFELEQLGLLKEETIEKYHLALDPLLNSFDYDNVRKNYYSDNKLPSVNKKIVESIPYHEAIVKTYKSIEDDICYTNKAYIKEVYLDSAVYSSIIVKILIEFYQKVNDFKQKHECFEFIDIAKFAIDIVKNNKDIQEELKASFKEILIDEYQDTNDIQEEFVRYISKNNVYMVGDIKQSIYKFRNANPKIFKEKYDNYKDNNGGIKIDLNKNFRSNFDVINSINRMFNKIMDDRIGNAKYKEEHQLDFGNTTYNDSPEKAKRIVYKTYTFNKDIKFKKHQIEIFTILKDIKEKIDNKLIIYDKDEKRYRECTYKDFAILSSKASHFDEAKSILEYNHIPTVVFKNEEIGNSIVIPLIINIAALICLDRKKEYKEEFKKNFFSVLRSFIFNYDDERLFDIISNNKMLDDPFYKDIHELALESNTISLSMLIEKIIYKFDIINKLITIGDIDNNIIRIEYLISIARDLEKIDLNVFDFVLYINDIFDNSDKLEFQGSGLQENKVRIMTIHKSKGLEFPFVYLMDCSSKFNYDDLKNNVFYDNNYGIITPYNQLGEGKNVQFYLAKNEYILENISEQLRLLYVALTRAREFLIILNPDRDDLPITEVGIVNDNTRSSYNSFASIYYSINDELNTYHENIDIEALNLNEKYKEALKIDRKGLIKVTDKTITYKKNNIDSKALEKSHASKLVRTKLDKETKDAMHYGTYIHEVFESFDLVNPNYDGYLPNEKKYLENFVNSDLLSNVKSGKVYKEFEFIYNEGEKQIHGIIDLMIIYENHIDIIDYKLKHVNDENYENQLKTYQKYIENKLKMKTFLHLYSIIDNRFRTL